MHSPPNGAKTSASIASTSCGNSSCGSDSESEEEEDEKRIVQELRKSYKEKTDDRKRYLAEKQENLLPSACIARSVSREETQKQEGAKNGQNF